MKHMKKALSVLLTLVAVFALSTSAFATSITITNGAANSEYGAYKLLTATPPTQGDTSGKYNFAMNEKYAGILKEVTGKTTDADVVAYIKELSDEGARAFADAVYKKILADDTLTPDYTTDTNKFESVAMGYYLIAETKVGDKSDTFSLVMLDTAAAGPDENISVATKEDKPTVDKQVEEKNDSTGVSGWGESADYDIGDTINYKITGTVSNKYDGYKSYYYSFGDTMDNSLDLNQDSIVIKIGETDVTEQFDVKTTDHSFTATANLKELTDVIITADSKIVVTYTAVLNENAVSGTAGNKNEVVLKYENDPYHEGDGEPSTPDAPDNPGETPKDTNIVFTFDAIVDKVDDNSSPLDGAGFTLYKWDAATNAWVAVGQEITNVTTFRWNGLDVGKYKLVETTVPSGYNKADDVEFEIVATYDKSTVTLTELTVTGGNFNVTLEPGEIDTDIVNRSGLQLPETGGIGTTIFYVAGSILVLGAAVLLITKKRMSVEQ